MMTDSQFLDVAKYIMTNTLKFTGPSVDKPSMQEIETGHKKVYAGNLRLNLYDGSIKGLLDKAHYQASASKQLGTGNEPDEHFVTSGVCLMDSAIIGWYMASKN
jgi:hypothetical protein